MRQAIAVALTLIFATAAAPSVESTEAEVTLEGTVMCAKCTLKKEGATECQDVVVVEKEGESAEYYVVKNEVSESFGHTCQSKTTAKVTGTVEEKDGKSWITATVIEKVS